MSTGTATAGAPAVAHRTATYSWVVLAMLAFIYIFNFLDRQLMSTLIESIKKDTGFTDKQMGFMTGFNFALFYTVFGVIVGFLADRTSRRNILFAGAFLWSGFTALCGMAQTYPVMLAARAGVGVGEAAGAPPSYSIISDYFPPEKRGLALALFSLGVPLGQAFAVAFGAQIDIIWGWRYAFIGIGIAGVVASIMLLLIVREPKRGAMDHSATVSREQAEANASVKEGFLSTVWQFVSRPMLLWTALGCGFTAFVGYASLVWNAPFFLRVLGMTREELSIWYALAIGLGIGLGTWASGALTDMLVKRSKAWFALMPAIAMALAAPFWYFYTQQSEWGMAVIILSVPLFLTIMYLAPALALVQNSVKPSQRTMSGAILLMILNGIGLGGGPTLVGTLSTNFTADKVAGGHGSRCSVSRGPPRRAGMDDAVLRGGRGLPAPGNDGDQPRGQSRRAGPRRRLPRGPGACRRRHRGPLLPVPGSRLPQCHREHEPHRRLRRRPAGEPDRDGVRCVRLAVADGVRHLGRLVAGDGRDATRKETCGGVTAPTNISALRRGRAPDILARGLCRI